MREIGYSRGEQHGETPVAFLGLPQTPEWALRGAGLPTVEKVAERSQADVAAIEGVGRTTVLTLARALQARGLRFAHSFETEVAQLSARTELRKSDERRRGEAA